MSSQWRRLAASPRRCSVPTSGGPRNLARSGSAGDAKCVLRDPGERGDAARRRHTSFHRRCNADRVPGRDGWQRERGLPLGARRGSGRVRWDRKTVNCRRQRHGEHEIRFGVRLNVGEVFYGNVGALDRLDFTVMGRRSIAPHAWRRSPRTWAFHYSCPLPSPVSSTYSPAHSAFTR